MCGSEYSLRTLAIKLGQAAVLASLVRAARLRQPALLPGPRCARQRSIALMTAILYCRRRKQAVFEGLQILCGSTRGSISTCLCFENEDAARESILGLSPRLLVVYWPFGVTHISNEVLPPKGGMYRSSALEKDPRHRFPHRFRTWQMQSSDLRNLAQT